MIITVEGFAPNERTLVYEMLAWHEDRTVSTESALAILDGAIGVDQAFDCMRPDGSYSINVPVIERAIDKALATAPLSLAGIDQMAMLRTWINETLIPQWGAVCGPTA